METYHRRRYKKVKEANFEMEYSKEQDQKGISGAADTPPSPRHDFVPPPLPKSDHCLFQINDIDHEVSAAVDSLFNNIESLEVGSVYEINHIHLPPRIPVQLRSIRVAMVSERTQMNVAVRFPSMESLKTYLSNSIREMYPELDEKFVMGTVLAAKVLLRQVPSHEFTEKKHLEGFWLANASTVDASDEDNSLKKGKCLSELKCNGMVRWGIRRQVKFLERHKENININVQSSSSFVKGSEEIKMEAFGKKEEDNEDENDEEEEEDDDNDNEDDGDDDDDEREDGKDEEDIADEEALTEESTQETDRNLKRKRYKLRNNNFRQKAKTVKLKREKKKPKKSHGNKGRNKCRELLGLGNPRDRWSAERYQLATKNLLEVMIAKGATASNPILRPELRAEARKRIGDTGLLDHLLKHMAGKLAPGGSERFRRRHNADGAMEYWLESADLVNVRMEAGVNDPYWIPPPGWKPGDCPTQDPICAKELRLLKEEIIKLKRNAQEMVPRKQFEEEVLRLRREIEELVSSKKQKENQAMEVLSNPCCIGQKLDHPANSLVSSKFDLAKTPNLMEKYQEQLMVISDFVKVMELEIKSLTKGEGKTRSDSALMVSTESCAEKEKNHLADEQKGKEQEVQGVVLIREEGSVATKAEKAATTVAAATAEEKAATTVAAATAEEKAAKVQRLKSGFRICKPQGTFLWPNMARNNCNSASAMSNNTVPQPPQVVIQVEDLFVVPTPSSVSSSSALSPPQLPCNSNNHNHPASPVKPLAERRAVTVTVSTLPNGNDDQGYSTTTTTTTTTKKNPIPINLNDIPSNPIEGFCGNPSSHHTVTTTTVMPRLLPDATVRKEMNQMITPWDVMNGGAATTNISGAMEVTGNDQQRLSKCSSSSASCLSAEVGNWLALATAHSASDESSQG